MKMQKLFLPAVTLALAVNLTPVMAAHGDGAPDRVDDHANDRANDHATDRANDRATDRANDRATDRANDRTTDRHRHSNLRHKVARIFKALDTNEDEIITLDEFLSKLLAKSEKQFDRIDIDDDGLISFDEFLAVHDGKDDHPDIDVEALRACIAERVDFVLPDPVDRGTRFEELDSNNDGFIDFDEFVAAKTEQATNRFNAVDADADGGITKKELYNALKQQQARKAIRRECVEEQREVDELLEG